MPAYQRRIASGGSYLTFPADRVNALRVFDEDLELFWKYNPGATVWGTAMDVEGNVYIGGARASSITTRKLDIDGGEVWSADHGNTVYCIAVDSSGNVYTGGTVSSSVTTRKYNSAGTEQWNADHKNTVYCIAVDSSGNVYTGGRRYTTASPQGHVRKYNSSGSLQWTLDIGSDVDYIYGIAVDSSGNFYVTGSRVFSSPNYLVTRKYNSSRTLQWSVDEGAIGRALALDSGAFYTSFDRNSSKSIRKRSLSDGSETWVADTGGNAQSIAVDADGNVYAGSADYTIRKFNSSGTEQLSISPSLNIYALAVVDVELADLSHTSPALALAISLQAPFPTAIVTVPGAGLAVVLSAPASVLPIPPPLGDAQPIYRCYAGTSPVTEIPMASLQCQRRYNESTWLTVITPPLTPILAAALQSLIGATLTIEAGTRTIEGETLGQMMRAQVTEIDPTRTPGGVVVRVRARIDVDLEPLQTRILTGISQRFTEDGRRKVRCTVIPALRPGDSVDTGDAVWVAHTISYRIDPFGADMDVQEPPNG